MSRHVSMDALVQAEKRLEEICEEADRSAEEERQRAYRTVSAALTTYRWWGWTNIKNTVLIAMSRWRYARKMAKWKGRYPNGFDQLSDTEAAEANEYAMKLGL